MKKIFCLLLCLTLIASMLALASCTGGDDKDTDKSSGTESSKDSGAQGGNVDSQQSGANQDGGEDTPPVSSTPDSGTTDESTNQGGTNSSDQGGENSSTNQSGGGDEKPDIGEKITIKFTCVSGTLVSGSKEIKINKGSALLLNEMPVFERKGYEIMWSYDMFGEQAWALGDVFDKDTTLFATWKSENSFDGLLALVSKIKNFQMDTTMSITSNGMSFSQSTVTMYDGRNAYSEISAEGMTEKMWYVDGMFYTVYGDQLVKSPLSDEEYEMYFGDAAITESSVFGINRDHVSTVSKDGNVYTVAVDCAKYSASIAGTTPVELVYTKMVYTFEFDENGLLTKLVADINLTADGAPQENVSTSTFVNVGTTVVTAPENADEFVPMGE